MFAVIIYIMLFGQIFHRAMQIILLSFCKADLMFYKLNIYYT